MDLQFTESQQLLKNSVERMLADTYDFDTRKKIIASPAGWSEKAWSGLAELGLLMIPFAEEDGGMGGGGVELMIAGEAFGRALVVEPYMAGAVLAGTALRYASAEDRAAMLPELMDGSVKFAYAGGADVLCEGGRLNGKAAMVLGGDTADRLVVAAHDARGQDVIALVDATAATITRDAYALQGGGRAADVTFEATPATVLFESNEAGVIKSRIDEAGIMFLVAEALGASQAAFDYTVAYLKTRVQFGHTLGTNQALQHRCAEMYVELEQLRSAAIYAAFMIGEENAAERAKAISATKIVAAKAARFIAQQSVQLHGGIGVTEEYIVAHYFKRLSAICMLFGGADYHIARLAEAGGFVSAGLYWQEAAGV